MRTILCYGDSNTWGAEPVTSLTSARRYPREIRWTGVLSQKLGNGYEVIEEGNPGRTTIWDDPIEGYKNGRDYLIPCLDTHQPLDLVILMLGTNDLKYRFSLSAFDIARSAGVLVGIIQDRKYLLGGPPEVLLVAPPPITQLTDLFKEMFEGAIEKSKDFPNQFRRVAEEYGCHFLDASMVITPSEIDGIHYSADNHQKLGSAMAEKVKQILGVE